MGRLTENDIFKFLDLYKRSECLWKCSHKYYRIKSKRVEAYVRIKDVMNLSSVLEVKQKIKSFRDTYASERTKVRRSILTSRHPFEVYKPKLRWYNLADSFLNNREGILNVNCSLTVKDSHAGNTINPPPNVPLQRSEAIHSNLQSPPTYRMVNNNPAVNQHQMPQVHASDHHENQHNFRLTHQPRQLNSRQIPGFCTEKNLAPQTGEFYHFGMNIAMQLSSLPLVKALNVQTKIQQMLCEERIAHEQSRYEIVYNSSHSQFAGQTDSKVVNNPQVEFQDERISFLSSPKDDDDIKVEYLVEDVAENMQSIDL